MEAIITSETNGSDLTENLQKNILFFCKTPLGSLPQRRDFGIDYSILEEPFPVMRMKATVAIVSGLRKFYGVNVSKIDISADESGKVRIKIII